MTDHVKKMNACNNAWDLYKAAEGQIAHLFTFNTVAHAVKLQN